MFFKKVAAVFIGTVSAFLVGAMLIGALMSNSTIPGILGAVTVMTVSGAYVIFGIYLAIIVGRGLCERIFGWFY